MLTQKQLYLTKVFIQMFVRNKQYIIFSLILPMVILGIVAFNEGDEDPIDIGLVDKSNTILSQQFTSRLNKNNLFILCFFWFFVVPITTTHHQFCSFIFPLQLFSAKRQKCGSAARLPTGPLLR